ncbi:hypothetical protein CDAR_613291 [Caerostris darwini]|uniref:Uncharacterized protein n=1 Tax=Caerostris darwini TaxID=1538125 RepID=A0AAV4V5K5_9ARAC|nr:hypothetical protein CDAR_613291 [Caerostris darwini]
MQNLLPIDFKALTIKCDIIKREIQDWRRICSDVTENAKGLMSVEVCNLTYPLCRRKQEEIMNFLRVLVNNREGIESFFRRTSELKALLIQHDNILLLKKLLIDETFLLHLMRNVDEAKYRVLQYENRLKRHEIMLRFKHQ